MGMIKGKKKGKKRIQTKLDVLCEEKMIGRNANDIYLERIVNKRMKNQEERLRKLPLPQGP